MTQEEVQKLAETYANTMKWLEKELNLPQDFMLDLDQEDDWSFIIKTHALVEAAVSNQLSSSTDPRLGPVFEQLELSDSRKGKIEFAKALNLLDAKQRKFIRFLSELRNQLVHNISKVAFTFDSYISSLDSNQRTVFYDSITYFATNTEAWRPYATKNPKGTISTGVLVFLIYTTVQGNTSKRERELVYKKAKVLDDVFGDSKDSPR